MFSIYGILSHLFFGFGLYNLMYLILKFTPFGKKAFYKTFDNSAVKTVIFLGFLFFIWYSFDMLILFTDADSTGKKDFLERLNGPYGFSLFAQQFLYIIFSLAFLIPYVKRFMILRLFFGLGLMLNFEKFVIFTTSLHRDYLPSSWTMYSTFTGSILLDWQFNMIIFICLSLVHYFYQLKKQSSSDII